MVRRVLAMVSMLLLLGTQVFPAFAICVCDHEGDRGCCDLDGRPVEAPPPPACCSHGVAATSADQDAVAVSHRCSRDVVSAGTDPVALSPPPETASALASVLTAPHVSAPHEVAVRGTGDGPRRGPPPGDREPLFLLHSSLLS